MDDIEYLIMYSQILREIDMTLSDIVSFRLNCDLSNKTKLESIDAWMRIARSKLDEFEEQIKEGLE